MIQLANDPNASRSSRAFAADGKAGSAAEAPRARSAHAWPFLSRHAERPATPGDNPKPAAASGS